LLETDGLRALRGVVYLMFIYYIVCIVEKSAFSLSILHSGPVCYLYRLQFTLEKCRLSLLVSIGIIEAGFKVLKSVDN